MAGLCTLLAVFAAHAAGSGVTLPVVEPRFVRFGAEHGLPTMINDLAVDRQGYVWLATADGLARYDGERFRFWRRESGVHSSLPDNDLIALAIDVDDRVWVISDDHLAVLNQNRKIFSIIKFSGKSTACGKDMVAISSAPKGGVRIATYDGTICMVESTGSAHFLFRLQDEVKASASPIFLWPAKKDEWMIATDVGVWREQGAKLKQIAPHLMSGAHAFAMTEDPDGSLWVGTDRGLFLLETNGNVYPATWQLPSLASNAIVRPARNGGYWIGTAVGLFHAASRNAPLRKIHAGRRRDGLSSGVFSMVLDLEGGLWIASYSQGISYLPSGYGQFAAIDEIVGDAVENVDPMATADDGAGGFWLLGSRMLYRISSNDFHPQNVASADSLGVEWFQALVRCQDDRLWLASFDRAVRLDPRTGLKLNEIRFADNGLKTPQSLFCDMQGRLWVSFFGGSLQIFSANGDFLKEVDRELVLGNSTLEYALLQFGPDGMPWVSDGHALRRWDGSRFVPIPFAMGDEIEALSMAYGKDIWLARPGSLERYAWRGGVLVLQSRINDSDLSMVRVSGIFASRDQQLWLTTPRGLIQFDIKTGRARNYGPRDGLPDIDFSLGAPQRGESGPAIALSKRGLVLFDPDRPLPEPRASPLAIETLELRRGEDTVPFDLPDADGGVVTMSPGDRDLRVVARVMSFVDPASHRYRFRLRGYDPGWVDQGERSERVFSSLPPGEYTLEIEGANADGVWSSTRRIALMVEAPWWRRWWALVLYTFAASGLVWWLAYLDRRQLERRHNYQLVNQKHAMAEAASQAKSRFLANLGHEVRTPMTGVLGMSELLLTGRLDDRQEGQVRAIRRAGEHLLRLVNDALDLARIEAGRFELDESDFMVDVIIDDVVGLMRPLAERKGLRFVLEIRQILLNLIGNAIKFTEQGEVSLSLGMAPPQGLRCTVRDTGPGLGEEQQRRLFRRFEQAEGARTASRYGGSGLGLAICQELAVAMGGGIDVSSAPGEGTCFILRLPLARVDGLASMPGIVRMPDAVAREVLLVEDDAIVAEVLIGLLQAQGHRATHAGHALAAMTANATQSFDLALIDLDLPGMDGLALARQLRAQGFGRPMIAITARADTEAEPEAMAAGFDAFLRKPLTGELLAEAIAAQYVSMQ
jgi:signal transduction histidine kinase/ligand-binding sensor domain-containing protein/ActR/RegA family two-component response regulator